MKKHLLVPVIILGIILGALTSSAADPSSYAISINVPAFRLYLYRDGVLWHDYPVAVGKPATPTPIGEYRIINRIHNPVWRPAGKKPVPPGPTNPLGAWWLGLSAYGYGIHGCLDESSIGKAVSKGCIRLHNRDVAQLVQIVGPGTPVRIVYEPYALREDPESGRLWLWAGRDIYARRSWPRDALSFLTQQARLPWDREAAGALLAQDSSPDWLEIPLTIQVFRREQPVGRGYVWDGQIWFNRLEADRLPGGSALPPGEREFTLTELADLTAETVDWRYDAAVQTLTAYPARLRKGGEVWEGAVRVIQGRVYLEAAAALAALASQPAAAVEVPAGGVIWVPVAEQHPGSLLHWSPEEWEVVVDGS